MEQQLPSRGLSRAATRLTHAVPQHPPLRTGSLPALYPQQLEFPLQTLFLCELRRDRGETSHKKVGRGSSITQKELKII